LATFRTLIINYGEDVVLLTVAVLHGNAYGIAIKEDIELRLKRNVSVGALRRLEDKGFLESEFGEATAVRGGKHKRYHKVTPLGKKILDYVMDSRLKLWNVIPANAFQFK
jgi:PadR family transcriptional regulator, regulatory protein PadR